MPLIEYQDSITEEKFEILYRSTSDIKDEVINEDTGNKATRIYSFSKGFGSMELTTEDRRIAKINHAEYKAGLNKMK